MAKTKNRKQKQGFLQLLTEFAKLQLASYIPFWGKYLGFAFLDNFTRLPEFWSLLIPLVLANIVFFIVDDKWVFIHSNRRQKTTHEAMKFALFIAFSETIVFTMTLSMSTYLHITPYIGQFISGFVMAIWTFFGLKYLVFNTPGTQVSKKKVARTRKRRSTKTA